MLKLLGAIYGKAADLRNRLYDRGTFKSREMGVPVISIGNITAGGTGKTPLVAFCARALSKRGEKVCVVSRGYGRENERELVVVSDGERVLSDAARAGDEPFELANDLIGFASVLCDADRVRGGRYAAEKLGATAIVLDDAFQHRRIVRDLDIVTVDATRPDGGGRMIPAGRLREPWHNLARADAVVITRSDLAEDIEAVRALVRTASPDARIFLCRSESADLIPIEPSDPSDPAPERPRLRYFLFSGIGNPGSLISQLEQEKFDIAGHRSFRDHHKYSKADLDEIEEDANACGAGALLTTAKDAVKLPARQHALPCYIVKSRLVFDDEPAFLEFLREPFN